MTLSAQLSPRVAALLAKTRRSRGRLIFALDATGSREPTWDFASQLQAAMFEEAAKIGGLDVQLVYYRGTNEVRHSSWFSDARELVSRMSAIRCSPGATKIARVLGHIRSENEREKVSAAVFIGDAVEERPDELYHATAGLGVPMFWFQEGDGRVMLINPNGCLIGDAPLQTVEYVFRELARLTGGAYGRFDAGAAKQLENYCAPLPRLRSEGLPRLPTRTPTAARRLLGQMK